MRKKIVAILAGLALLIGGVILFSPSAEASVNCGSASASCRHTFHITADSNTKAIDITLLYDVQSTSTSGYKKIGCSGVVIKTNPKVSVDAVQVAIETHPDTYGLIGSSIPCKLGGTAETNNDVDDASYTYLGDEPFQSFENRDAPFVKASVWGLTGASDGRRNQYWALP